MAPAAATPDRPAPAALSSWRRVKLRATLLTAPASRPTQARDTRQMLGKSPGSQRVRTRYDAGRLAQPGRLQPQVANKAREWLTGAGDKALGDWDISRDAPYFGIPIPDAPGTIEGGAVH